LRANHEFLLNWTSILKGCTNGHPGPSVRQHPLETQGQERLHISITYLSATRCYLTCINHWFQNNWSLLIVLRCSIPDALALALDSFPFLPIRCTSLPASHYVVNQSIHQRCPTVGFHLTSNLRMRSTRRFVRLHGDKAFKILRFLFSHS